MGAKSGRPGEDESLVVGVTRLARMFKRSREWAERLLREWKDEQLAGGPILVFRQGERGSLFTTTTVIQRRIPQRGPADVALARRLQAAETEVSDLHRRIDALLASRSPAAATVST